MKAAIETTTAMSQGLTLGRQKLGVAATPLELVFSALMKPSHSFDSKQPSNQVVYAELAGLAESGSPDVSKLK
jgi:hypothetical protein